MAMALFLLNAACAEGATLWQGLQFGMTEEEILRQCQSIAPVYQKPYRGAMEYNELPADAEPMLDPLYGGKYLLTWAEGLNSYLDYVEGDEVIPKVSVRIYLDDDDRLSDIVFEYGPSSTELSFQAAGGFEAYERRVSRLTQQLGAPFCLNQSEPCDYNGAVMYDYLLGDFEAEKQSAEWVVDNPDGTVTKVECAYQVYSDGSGSRVWCYSHMDAE